MLHAVWSSEVCQSVEERRSPIAETLRNLLPQPVIHLVTNAFGQAPYATYASAQLDEGFTLADVLEQELDITVEDDDIVLIEPRSFTEDWTYNKSDLGAQVQRLLVGLAMTNKSESDDIFVSDLSEIENAAGGQASGVLTAVASPLN